MSYRSFKRALGETNLERKCRFLFGTCLLVLISGSFWWYSTATDRDRLRVPESLRRQGAGRLRHARCAQGDRRRRRCPTVLAVGRLENQTNESLADLFRSQQIHVGDPLPENPANAKQPDEQFEFEWMNEWTDFADEMRAKAASMTRRSMQAYDDPDNQLWHESPAERRRLVRLLSTRLRQDGLRRLPQAEGTRRIWCCPT